LLRHYSTVELRDTSVVADELRSYLACCDVVDTILAAKRDSKQCVALMPRLRAALHTHMDAHLRCYGPGRVKPKAHWAMDLPALYAADGRVTDGFVLERLHLGVKLIGENVKNTDRFERAVLSGIYNTQWHAAEKATPLGIRGRIAPLLGWPGVVVGDEADAGFKTVASGDVVAHGELVGQIVAILADETGCLLVVVDAMLFLARQTSHSSRWRPTRERCLWRVLDVDPVLAWYVEADAVTVVHR